MKSKGETRACTRDTKSHLVLCKRSDEQLPLETVIFIILNLVFAATLLYFVAKAGGGAMLMEEKYAKQIALMMDNAKPGMQINIPLTEQEKEVIKKSGIDFKDVLKFDKNYVIVKFAQRGGYQYSYFSDLEIDNEKGMTGYQGDFFLITIKNDGGKNAA